MEADAQWNSSKKASKTKDIATDLSPQKKKKKKNISSEIWLFPTGGKAAEM
jgi:hypothetical protein